jgi:hypothetical protein
VRLQLVITIESIAELHRPRWDDHPTRPHRRQLHIGFDSLDRRQIHLILASEAATELFQLMQAIIDG